MYITFSLRVSVIRSHATKPKQTTEAASLIPFRHLQHTPEKTMKYLTCADTVPEEPWASSQYRKYLLHRSPPNLKLARWPQLSPPRFAVAAGRLAYTTGYGHTKTLREQSENSRFKREVQYKKKKKRDATLQILLMLISFIPKCWKNIYYFFKELKNPPQFPSWENTNPLQVLREPEQTLKWLHYLSSWILLCFL